MLDIIKEILILEKVFTETNYEWLKKALVHIKSNLIDFDGNVHLNVDSLIQINNLITCSNNITLKKVNVKPHRFDKMYMGKDLIQDKLYQVIDQFNKREITAVQFYSIILNQKHPFYDLNVRTCKIMFANDIKTNRLIDRTKAWKTNNIKWIFIALNAQCLQKIAIIQSNGK